MSKGKVWNKGKHNGGVGSKAGANPKITPKTNDAATRPETVEPISPETMAGLNRVNSVKRMNRDNWVVRPERAVQKGPKQE
ncbi:MAG: hypothetical protein ACE3L7_05305 [Candidatus Pristimantibacillus sp.]